jgi:hypothetical protein
MIKALPMDFFWLREADWSNKGRESIACGLEIASLCLGAVPECMAQTVGAQGFAGDCEKYPDRSGMF